MPGKLKTTLVTACLFSCVIGVSHAQTFFIPTLPIKGADATKNLDTTLHMSYSSGFLAQINSFETNPNADVKIKLYLFNPDGTQYSSRQGLPVCTPCEYTLSKQNPRQDVHLASLLQSKGGIPDSMVAPTGIIVASGDISNFTLQAGVDNVLGKSLDIAILDVKPNTAAVAVDKVLPVPETKVAEPTPDTTSAKEDKPKSVAKTENTKS